MTAFKVTEKILGLLFVDTVYMLYFITGVAGNNFNISNVRALKKLTEKNNRWEKMKKVQLARDMRNTDPI